MGNSHRDHCNVKNEEIGMQIFLQKKSVASMTRTAHIFIEWRMKFIHSFDYQWHLWAVPNDVSYIETVLAVCDTYCKHFVTKEIVIFRILLILWYGSRYLIYFYIDYVREKCYLRALVTKRKFLITVTVGDLGFQLVKRHKHINHWNSNFEL